MAHFFQLFWKYFEKKSKKEESQLDPFRRNTEKKPNKPQEALLEQISKTVEQSRRGGFFKDVLITVRSARPYRLYQSFLARLRGLRMIGLILRIIGYVFAFLQTGTLFLLTAALLFVILPLLVLGSASILLIAWMDIKKSRKHVEECIQNKNVYVFFTAGAFTVRWAKELAQNENALCLIISPHWISPSSPACNRFYLNRRGLAPGVLLIRRYFYFHLRKKSLQKEALTLIY